MPASAAPVTTAQVLKVHDALARYVYGNFKRGLTFEEARDVAAEALAEADRAVAAGTEIRDLKQWLRTAAWRNALDAIRPLHRVACLARQPGSGHSAAPAEALAA